MEGKETVKILKEIKNKKKRNTWRINRSMRERDNLRLIKEKRSNADGKRERKEGKNKKKRKLRGKRKKI